MNKEQNLNKAETPAFFIPHVIGSLSLFNADNISILKTFKDNEFEIAIVDPPYGIGQNWSKDRKSKFYNHRNSFNDKTPGEEYFKELLRVSKNQIIWGCNYFWNYLPPTNHLIFWDKGKDAKTQFGSAGELAWLSFTKYPLLKYDFLWNGCCVCERTTKIHPHQKPVKLYEQCLNDFAAPGDKILDTHLGSGSSAIAAAKLKFEFVGIEKDKNYYDKAIKRIEQFIEIYTKTE